MTEAALHTRAELISDEALSTTTTEATLLKLIAVEFEIRTSQSFVKVAAQALGCTERYINQLISEQANATPTMLHQIERTCDSTCYTRWHHIHFGGTNGRRP